MDQSVTGARVGFIEQRLAAEAVAARDVRSRTADGRPAPVSGRCHLRRCERVATGDSREGLRDERDDELGGKVSAEEVYLVRAGESGPSNIGSSSTIRTRLRRLQSSRQYNGRSSA
jgi:hypothetical protein